MRMVRGLTMSQRVFIDKSKSMHSHCMYSSSTVTMAMQNAMHHVGTTVGDLTKKSTGALVASNISVIMTVPYTSSWLPPTMNYTRSSSAYFHLLPSRETSTQTLIQISSNILRLWAIKKKKKTSLTNTSPPMAWVKSPVLFLMTY